MQKPEGLAKAAAVMAMVAALATMLAVNVEPPVMQNARNTRGSEARIQGIPVPPSTSMGGMDPDPIGAGPEHVGAGPERVGAGAVQGRGMAVERREAGGGRAPKNLARSRQ